MATAGGAREGAGRPVNPDTAKDIWDREIVALVKLSRKTRIFAEEQLDELQAEAKTVTGGIKVRLEIARTAVQLVDTLGKITKVMMEQLDKDPKDSEEKFDLGKLLEQQN